MPPATAALLKETGRAAGVNVRLARNVGVAPTQPTYLVPARNAMCVAGPLTGCDTAQAVAAHGLVTVGLNYGGTPGTMRAAGVVPDRFRSVRVTVEDGAVVERPIHDNTFDVIVSTVPVRVTVISPEGRYVSATPSLRIRELLSGQKCVEKVLHCLGLPGTAVSIWKQ
jgi:hypothetical protein